MSWLCANNYLQNVPYQEHRVEYHKHLGPLYLGTDKKQITLGLKIHLRDQL